MATITARQAAVLREFGFRFAKGTSVTEISYGDIRAVEPTPMGFRVVYRDHNPTECTDCVLIALAIPTDLETEWSFAYYDKITHRDRVDQEGQTDANQEGGLQ
jgi:hypothetical protein